MGQTDTVCKQNRGVTEKRCLIYLHMTLIHATFQTSEIRRHLTLPLFSAMAIGFGCYVLIPAETPLTAHPDLFVSPALTGGAVTTLSAAIHESAAAKYDVFPSLHVLNTLILLAFDWRHVRRRFWIMLTPSALMLVATLYLRFHYGIDLLASILIFTALAIWLPELRANLISKRPEPKRVNRL
ncbi:MAG: membrane-associated phospholipid phosphatase [Paracoccaceae bacterium]|jgi:membrane-associated phospholipid phosphatase